MRKSYIRLPLLFGVMLLVGFGFYFYINNFTGDGKKTPEEALPTDHDYEWIEGPKTQKEIRYFFLSDGNYFGTGVVKKNAKGWSAGHGAYSEIPKPLEENKITSAYSDQKIIFGLIKTTDSVTVKVNNKIAKLQSLNDLSKDVIDTYEVTDCYIWYVDLETLKNKETFTIQVLDEKDHIINELKI